MAEVIQRVWKSGPRKVKRVAWGYTLQIAGKQVRKYDRGWTEQDAEKALAAQLLGLEVPEPPSSTPSKTFAEIAADYLTFKR